MRTPKIKEDQSDAQRECKTETTSQNATQQFTCPSKNGTDGREFHASQKKKQEARTNTKACAKY